MSEIQSHKARSQLGLGICLLPQHRPIDLPTSANLLLHVLWSLGEHFESEVLMYSLLLQPGSVPADPLPYLGHESPQDPVKVLEKAVSIA